MDFVIIFLYGIFVGCMTGMLGAGGGTLIVPFLHLYLGLPIKTAIGTSLFQVSGIAASGASQHYRFGSSDLKLASILIISGSSMAFVGAKFAKLVPDNALKLVFGIFVIAVALKFMKSKSKEKTSEDSVQTVQTVQTVKNEVKVNQLNSQNYNMFHNLGKFLHVNMVSPIPMYMHRKTKIAEYTINVPKVFLLGGIVGFSSGVLGVGGGFLLVPGLAFLGVPMKIAVGTDLTQIIASASVGTATYYPDGYVDLAVGSLLMVGGIIGTFIGTRLNKKLPASTLKKSFGILMLFVGVLMISKAVL